MAPDIKSTGFDLTLSLPAVDLEAFYRTGNGYDNEETDFFIESHVDTIRNFFFAKLLRFYKLPRLVFPFSSRLKPGFQV